ncbi:heptosyltransferase [Chelonobacter oris]|uniref:Heptosyltransferase n=1 Tax=Chelonobacter oris TaxID=505317 RepID=A0A0A3BAH4_9PAST|nr:glycosyltransferase family 9 protein [Chelonobacter oris]KGQ70564.1 heptosyltransferase [Chelonobacter oris]
MKKIKALLRRFRIMLGKFLLDKRKKPFPVTELPSIKRILFLRQDGKIGDYIVSSFVFRELKKASPDIEIGVVCSDSTLFEKNRHIDHIYRVKKKNILDYIKTGLKLRKEQYNVLIDPTVFLRNRDLLLLRLIDAKITIGYQKENYGIFNLNIVDSGQHFADIYAEMLSLLGVNSINKHYDIPQDDNSKQNVAEFLQQSHARQPIVLNCFGASRSRRLNNDKIIELLNYLTALCPQQTVILLTYPQVTQQLAKLAEKYDNVIIYQNTHTIFDSIALIRQAVLVISPDTSIVHIASGLNKKLIAFYQDTQRDSANFSHWHPNNSAETHILFYQNNINEIKVEDISADWFKQD